MEKGMIRKAVVLSFVSFYAFLVLPLMPLWAQDRKIPLDSDITAPIILHKPNPRPIPSGEPMVIRATVTDNVMVDEVLLFFRFMDTREYFSMNMDSLGDNIYSATIPDQFAQEPGLEYYIQASDKAGNSGVFRGFSFSPLTIKVVSVERPVVKAWYQKWWVWTVVGGIVVAAAAVAGGSSGGDVEADTSATGTATIKQPIP